MKIRNISALIAVLLMLLLLPGQALAGETQDVASQMKEIINNMQSEEAISQVCEKPAAEISSLNIMMQTTEGTDVKSEPDKTSDNIATLEAEQAIMVTGKTADDLWYEIYYEGQKAYIPAEMAEEAEVETGQAITAETVQNTDAAPKAKVHWMLILVGVFACIFCVSFAVLLQLDKKKQENNEASEK